VAAPPVAEGLFTWPAGEPRLIGSRCRDCGVVTFPSQGSCPACTSVAVEERLLPRTGTLYTWTVQGFRPKPPYAGPEEFEPYGVGYVELPGEVRVEARLTVADPARLRIGMPMELVIVPFGETVTYAFAPLDGPGRDGRDGSRG
jgi:uncharacterized OB-fold protein